MKLIICWKDHIKEITSKLSSTFYAIRTMKNILNINTFRAAHNAHFHSIMRYGLNFGVVDSKRVFILQKRVVRIMTGAN